MAQVKVVRKAEVDYGGELFVSYIQNKIQAKEVSGKVLQFWGCDVKLEHSIDIVDLHETVDYKEAARKRGDKQNA